MATVTINNECYVSLEVAKLLKKAGFDWKCRGIYVLDSENDPEYVFSTANFTNTSKEIEGYIRFSAPTIDIAQRWLREVKNIDVVVSRAMQWKQFYYTITHEENRTSKIDFMSLNKDLWWFKYEEALEAGIQKALEIILEKGDM